MGLCKIHLIGEPRTQQNCMVSEITRTLSLCIAFCFVEIYNIVHRFHSVKTKPFLFPITHSYTRRLKLVLHIKTIKRRIQKNEAHRTFKTKLQTKKRCEKKISTSNFTTNCGVSLKLTVNVNVSHFSAFSEEFLLLYILLDEHTVSRNCIMLQKR